MGLLVTKIQDTIDLLHRHCFDNFNFLRLFFLDAVVSNDFTSCDYWRMDQDVFTAVEEFIKSGAKEQFLEQDDKEYDALCDLNLQKESVTNIRDRFQWFVEFMWEHRMEILQFVLLLMAV